MEEIDRLPPREALSVLLPVRNGWPHLREAVGSCLADMGADDELLILENGSTDESSAFVHRTAAEDSRVRVVETGAQNLAQALNVGIREARHDLLARMDADDVTLPGRFSRQVSEMAADSRLVLCGTQIRRFSTSVDRSSSFSAFPGGHEEIVAGLLKGQHVLCHPSVVFRREAALEVGGYWPDGLSEDCDFFLRLSRVGRLGNTPEVGLAYRFHPGSLNAQRQVDVLLGMRYAAATYWMDRQTIPSFAQYKADVLASRVRRIQLQRQALSDTLYRSAQMRLLAGTPTVSAVLQLAGSGLLRPGRAARRLLGARARAADRLSPSRSGTRRHDVAASTPRDLRQGEPDPA